MEIMYPKTFAKKCKYIWHYFKRTKSNKIQNTQKLQKQLNLKQTSTNGYFQVPRPKIYPKMPPLPLPISYNGLCSNWLDVLPHSLLVNVISSSDTHKQLLKDIEDPRLDPDYAWNCSAGSRNPQYDYPQKTRNYYWGL